MMWRPVEPLSRTPWTADFAAAKGRAIIFGVLAVIALIIVVRNAHREYHFPYTANVVAEAFSTSRGNFMCGWLRTDFRGQPYLFSWTWRFDGWPHRFDSSRDIVIGIGPGYLSPLLIVDINNPQNSYIMHYATLPSGAVLVIGTTFAVVSLYCGIVARAGRRRDISGDHRSPLR
ncbi:MAG: hypothetical protein FWC93_01830 [Defluviitaleaceae bacterium]|nr:hypothetical protein [Defluviitaleaceae bacterium]